MARAHQSGGGLISLGVGGMCGPCGPCCQKPASHVPALGSKSAPWSKSTSCSTLLASSERLRMTGVLTAFVSASHSVLRLPAHWQIPRLWIYAHSALDAQAYDRSVHSLVHRSCTEHLSCMQGQFIA